MRLVPSCSHHHQPVLVGMTTSYAITGNKWCSNYDAGDNAPRNLSRHVLFISVI